MSTMYPDKELALLTGIYYAGRGDLFKGRRTVQDIIDGGDAKIIDGGISQFGYVHKNCTMIELDNMDGVPIRVATTSFRDGFDCWLIVPENGMCVRV